MKARNEAERVVADLLALADCDSRSGEPLGKCMRRAAAVIKDLLASLTPAPTRGDGA